MYMMNSKLGALVVAIGLATSGAAYATTTCTFVTKNNVMSLTADCTTDETLFIPNGRTLDGRGHTITAVEPPVGNFDHAILQNAGAVANVRNVTLTALNLRDVCDVGEAKLRGILFEAASGSIKGTRLINVNKSGQGDCLSQGANILVRNTGPTPTNVVVTGNTVTGFSKGGIFFANNVTGHIAANNLEGLDDSGIAADRQFGIVVQLGATATVIGNNVVMHGRGSPPDVIGFENFESDNVTLAGNRIVGADYGIFQESQCFSGPSASGGLIVENFVRSRTEGITLVARSFDGTPCAAHVDRNRVLLNYVHAVDGVTGLSGIVLLSQFFGGSFAPVADSNVIKANVIGGYTNPIFRSGDTNTVVVGNQFVP